MIRLRLLGLLAIAGMAASAYSQTVVTNGLYAWYPLDGNAKDASGNGNDGIPYAVTEAADRYGNARAAYEFNGSNSVVTMASLSSSNLTELSLSVWIEPLAAPAVQGDIINKWRGFSYSLEDYALNIYSDLKVAFGNGRHGDGYYALANHCAITSTNGLSLGRWYHLVATIDASGTAEIWINGALSAHDYILPLLPPATEPVRVGELLLADNPTFNGAIFDSFNGLIDDVRIYNRPLSPSEIQQLYLAGGPTVRALQLVQPAFSNLIVSSVYQLQVSTDLKQWTNSGSTFNATNSSMVYPQLWQVDNWNQLFFRVQVAP